MLEFHKNKEWYFKVQQQVTEGYIIPFLRDHLDFGKDLKVLEIGCAEAGVLKAFTELGYQCTGIELSENRLKMAMEFMAEELEAGKIRFLAKNIYDIDVDNDLDYKFDLILLKDVIEHIHEQDVFIPKLKEFLNPGGMVFFGFPPWYMPFGGHQQMCQSKILSKLPYYHLLPMFAYKGLLKAFGESPQKIANLAEIKETGISIERFENIVKKSGFEIVRRRLFLLNPIYRWKFNIRPREQFGLISGIYFLRNFFTTAAYYLIK